MGKQNLNRVRQNPQGQPSAGNTRDQISAALSESIKKKYLDSVEVYGTLLHKIRGVAEDRDVEGLRTVQIELDNGENATESEVEEAMLRAFRNLPAIFEELGESLLKIPGNSYRGNIENLEELKIFLQALHEFFAHLQEELDTDNPELISAIVVVQNELPELQSRIVRMIDGMEELLASCYR